MDREGVLGDGAAGLRHPARPADLAVGGLEDEVRDLRVRDEAAEEAVEPGRVPLRPRRLRRRGEVRPDEPDPRAEIGLHLAALREEEVRPQRAAHREHDQDDQHVDLDRDPDAPPPVAAARHGRQPSSKRMVYAKLFGRQKSSGRPSTSAYGYMK